MTYTLVIHSHERRAGCAALLGLQFRARVDRQLAVGWLRRGVATAFAHRGCIVAQRIDRYSYVCVYLVLLVYQALLG